MATLWGYLDPAEHAVMVLDEVRVAAYARAIAQVVQPGDVVLDVGTGSGVLAILAARAGARRVFAVDRSGVVELARRHVQDNGVAGVVDVIRSDLAALDSLPEPPRVVLGEQLGNFAPAEHQHRLYAIARRLARPDAVMIPTRYRLTFGAVRATGLRDDLARLESLHGVRLAGLAERLAARPAFVHVDPDELLGPEVETDWLAADGPPPTETRARVVIDQDGEVGAIAVGFVAELAPGVELRTAVGAPRTHWTQTLFPIEPMSVWAGDALHVELVLRIVTNVSTWAWTVTRGDDRRDVDGVDAMLGDKSDLMAALRARPHPSGPVTATPTLRAWAAAMGAIVGDTVDVDDLARRARAVFPARYPTLDEARQDVLALIAAAERIG